MTVPKNTDPDPVDLVEQLLKDFAEASKVIHASKTLTEEEVLSFEAAHNRVRHYLSGWGR